VPPGPAETPATGAAQATPAAAPSPSRPRAFLARHERPLLFAAGGAIVLAVAVGQALLRPPGRALTQQDIDAAVLHTLENKLLPERAAKAAEVVRPSVVRVRGFADPATFKGKPKSKRPPRPDAPGKQAAKDAGAPDGLEEMSLGSGVVMMDDGIILTNLHVVFGAQRVMVTFHDGSESAANIVSVHPENDLAVIKAQKIPDDLAAATLASVGRLKPGDEVVAVGFPFGMGPSVSAGVVSGLNREFRSPEGERVLTQLIQFDAAVNPGSSGGPLITMQGDVVGIVTAILNPTASGTFIGIGFAVTIGAAGRAVGLPPF
jgi:serine protease DegQ